MTPRRRRCGDSHRRRASSHAPPARDLRHHQSGDRRNPGRGPAGRRRRYRPRCRGGRAAARMARDDRRRARPHPAPRRRNPARPQRRAGASWKPWTPASRSRRRTPSTSSPAPTASNITPASPPTIEGEQSISARPPSSIHGASRWASSPASAPGTTRSRSPVEVGAGARLRQRDDLQAERGDAAHRARSSPRSIAEAGLPDGVFNVVQGDGRSARALAAHPGIAKISLTGEVGTGKAVMARAGAHPEGSDDGTRRQVAADRLRRRRSRQRRLAARMLGNFYSAGRGLLQRHPRLRPRARARRASSSRSWRASKRIGRRRPARSGDPCRRR